MWDETIDALQNDYTCVSLDLPGFGDADNGVVSSLSEFAVGLMDLLSHISAEPWTIMGHSMGGYIALEVAAQFPNKISSLGLLNSKAGNDDLQKSKERKRSIKFISEMGEEPYLKLFRKSLIAPSSDKHLMEKLESMTEHASREGMIAALGAMMDRKDHAITLEEIKVPVLFVIGKEDKIIPYHISLKDASRCQDSYVLLLNKTGHVSIIEDKKKCLIAIRHFLLYSL